MRSLLAGVFKMLQKIVLNKIWQKVVLGLSQHLSCFLGGWGPRMPERPAPVSAAVFKTSLSSASGPQPC